MRIHTFYAKEVPMRLSKRIIMLVKRLSVFVMFWNTRKRLNISVSVKVISRLYV